MSKPGFTDYLGVWSPAPDPLPVFCGRSGVTLALTHVRWLEFVDGLGWCIPLPGTTEHAPTALPPHAPRSSKVLEARALEGDDAAKATLEAAKSHKASGGWLGEPGVRATGEFRVREAKVTGEGPYGPKVTVTGTIDGMEVEWQTGESCWCEDGETYTVRYTPQIRGTRGDKRVTFISRVQRVKPDAA